MDGPKSSHFSVTFLKAFFGSQVAWGNFQRFL
jgi:hypothetical protein